MTPRPHASTRFAASVLLTAACNGREAAPPPSVASPPDARVHATPVIACGPTDPVVPAPDGPALLAQLTGELRISLSEPPTRISPHDPRAEKPSPTATITSVTFKPYKLVNDQRAPLTDGELDRVIFRGTVLRLRSFGRVIDHADPDCAYTLRDLVRAIEATELQTRAHNTWSDGINLHHIYFQHLAPAADGTWRLGWAS